MEGRDAFYENYDQSTDALKDPRPPHVRRTPKKVQNEVT